MIDNNGYIVLSENYNDTGKFFGEVEGAVMTSLVKNKIFKKIDIFDLQYLCEETVEVSGSGNMLLNVRL